jgi:hypothetical protein
MITVDAQCEREQGFFYHVGARRLRCRGLLVIAGVPKRERRVSFPLGRTGVRRGTLRHYAKND